MIPQNHPLDFLKTHSFLTRASAASTNIDDTVLAHPQGLELKFVHGLGGAGFWPN
jgi:hypothetical protein